tara:strand:- start:13 stop:675 length:663 start_codon:yes stop_codon:yes gene_type:complete
MAFKMKSGNKVSFKNMGSSPAKNMKTGSYEHSFESPAKQYDHSEDVKTNIKSQSKRDKISNDAKKAASVLDGTSKEVATNTELKEQNKSNKQDQRGVDTPGGRRRTKSERIKAKNTDLELRRIVAEDNEARGEGKRGFSWKNAGMAALEGQGLMGAARSGIGTGDYESTRIKRKQTKRAGKAERKVTKATQKENRVAKRAAKRVARRSKVRKASDLSTGI